MIFYSFILSIASIERNLMKYGTFPNSTFQLAPILMSILLYHYKQLTKCISEVERIEDRVNSKKNGRPQRKKYMKKVKKGKSSYYDLRWLFHKLSDKPLSDYKRSFLIPAYMKTV
jgi:hypothetical protein